MYASRPEKRCPWSNVTLGSVACCIAGQTERQTPRLRPPQQLRSTTTSRCGATVGVVCVCVWSAQITRAACDPGGVRGQTGVRSSPRRCTTGGFPQLLLPLRAPGSARCSGVRTGAGARTVCLCCSSAAPPSFSHSKASHSREQRACMSVEVRASPKSSPEGGAAQTQLFSLHVPTVLCTVSVQPSPVPCRYCYIPHKRKNKPR